MGNYRIFLDTNVILDMLLCREGGNDAKAIISHTRKEECVVSLASFYTTVFYVEKYLKRNGVLGEQKVIMLRAIMNDLLDVLSVYGVDEKGLRSAISDMSFNDLEDSFQMQTAIAAGCNIVLTSNIKDFEHSNALPVMTPSEFVQEYMN